MVAAQRLRAEERAEPRSVRALRHAVLAYAEDLGVAEEVRGDIALAVTEAATNAVIHAFVGREPGTLLLVAEAVQDALLVRLLDDGRGMQPRADSPGLGMGLPTMGQLTSRLDIREGPGGRGTEVRMVFPAPGLREGRGGLAEDRLAVLEEVGRLAERTGWPAQGRADVAGVLVPRVAAACAVELRDDEAGTALPLVARGGPAPPPGLLAAAAGSGAPRREGGWVAAPLRGHAGSSGALALLPHEDDDPDALAAFAELLAERVAGAVATTRLVAELDRTRRRFEQVLGVLAEAVTVSDASGRLVYANAAAVDLLGARDADEVLSAPPGELAGRFLITLEDGSPVREWDLPRHEPGPDGVRSLLTRSVHRGSGRARWLLTKTTLLEDEETLAVSVIEDVTEAKEGERRQRLLAEAGALLTEDHGLEATLERLVRLVVPVLADWCAIDLLDDEGGLQRVGLGHIDPEKVSFGVELHRRYPPTDVEGYLNDGEPQLFAHLDDELLAQGAQDEEHLELLRSIGMRSALLVPLVARGRPTGVLTLVNAESGRAFTEADLAFATDLARRAGVAVEQARLLGPA